MMKGEGARRRRIIFNNDGWDARAGVVDATPERFLAQRTLALEGAQVDSIFYCTGGVGFGIFAHRTRVGQQGAWFARAREHIVADQLFAQGTDPLRVQVDWCRSKGIEVFWSMRMNDIHDATRPFLFERNVLKQSHPEYLLGMPGQPPACGHWSAVDYGREEIRNLAFEYIAEVCRTYDVDGVELDFFRHPMFFRRPSRGLPADEGDLEAMSVLLRRVHDMMRAEGQRRGRSLMLAVRTPDSIPYCRHLGLDVEHWMAEGWIQLWIPGGDMLFEPVARSVETGRKHGVDVYPCLQSPWVFDAEDQEQSEERLALVRRHAVQAKYAFQWSYTRSSLECYRGRAMNAWAAGASGVYLFNYFDPLSPAWRELGSPETLQPLGKVYPACVMGARFSDSSDPRAAFLRVPVVTPDRPMTISGGKATEIEVWIGDDSSSGPRPDVRLEVRVEGVEDPADLRLAVNGSDYSTGRADGRWIELVIEPSSMHAGTNMVRLLPARAVELRDLRIRVRPGQ